MKALIIVTKGETGGAQNSVFNLAAGLKEKGVEVIVGSGEGQYLAENLKRQGIRHIIFKNLRRTKNPLKNLFFIFELKKIIDREKFNTIHFNSSNSLFGAIGAKMSKNKPRTIFTFHGLSVLDPNYQVNFLFQRLYKLIFKLLLSFVETSVFVSKNNLDYALKNKIVKRGTVIYNGLDLKDLDFFDKNKAIEFLEQKTGSKLSDKFLIGSIGRLAYPKNYEFLIETFQDIIKSLPAQAGKPSAIGIIIGEGPERNKYQELIKKNNLSNVFFLAGEVKDAYKYLKALDLFVLPSIYEGLSISLIETLFAKVPAVASNVGGNAEILNSENLYTSGNKEEFLKKIKSVSTAQVNKLENFEIEQMAEKYIAIYKNVSKN